MASSLKVGLDLCYIAKIRKSVIFYLKIAFLQSWKIAVYNMGELS